MSASLQVSTSNTFVQIGKVLFNHLEYNSSPGGRVTSNAFQKSKKNLSESRKRNLWTRIQALILQLRPHQSTRPHPHHQILKQNLTLRINMMMKAQIMVSQERTHCQSQKWQEEEMKTLSPLTKHFNTSKLSQRKKSQNLKLFTRPGLTLN